MYLSPVIDCFDGMVHSWTIGTSPNAQLVNNMLEKALANLRPSEHPIIHSDRQTEDVITAGRTGSSELMIQISPDPCPEKVARQIISLVKDSLGG